MVYVNLAKCRRSTGDARTTRVRPAWFTNRNTRHFVVAGRRRSVPGHAMESLTQVRYGMWFLSQFPYVDRTTYIPILNLTSETHKRVLLWTSLTLITDSEQDSNHD